jgi:ribosomal protein S18 acetylase RimI-like enzyme
VALEVRRAAAQDAPVVADVAARTFALACPPHVTPEAIASFVAGVLSRERFDAYLADPQRDVLLAEDDGAPAGYAMVVHVEPADPDVAGALRLRPTAELSKIYVVPDHHGAGVGAALMDASLGAARRRGAAGIWLGVNQLNVRAQRFYAKSGFARVGTKRFLVGDRFEDDYVYERPLAG